MATKPSNVSDSPLAKIMDLIVELAQGRLDARGTPTGNNDEYDAIIVGLNMLAEELERSRRTVSRLDALAFRDPLTGLPNRYALEADLKTRIMQRKGNCADHPTLDLAFIDLDRFKPVNDTYGHAEGDRVLQQTAKRIAAEIRAGDLVARIGGDEFAVLMDVPTAGTAHEILDRAVSAISRPIGSHRSCDQHAPISVSASGGLAIYPRDGRDAAELLAHADAQMYLAKKNPRKLRVSASAIAN